MNNPSRFIRTIISGIVLFAAAQLGRAQTDIWNGGGGNNNLFWLSTANWAAGTLPQTGDQLVFTNNTSLLNSNNYTAGSTFSGITFATPAGAFVLNGKSVTLTANITDLQPVTPQTINLPLIVNSPANLNLSVVANGELDLNNTISGTGALTNSGAGVVYLNGTNTGLAGPLVINGGTVVVSRTNNLPVAPTTPTPGNIVLNSGALETTANFGMNTNRGIALGPTSGSGYGVLSVDNVTTLTNGSIMANNGAGTGGLTKIGFGNLLLYGANTYTGPTTNTIGYVTLDFTRATAPAANIISSSSALVMGGGNAGPQAQNFAWLSVYGKSGSSQTFAGTHFTYGSSMMLVSNLAGGLTTVDLGAMSHDAGGTLTLGSSSPGSSVNVHTSSGNTGGILGGWALIGGVGGSISAGQSFNGIPVYTGTNYACVDANGYITNFNNYYNYFPTNNFNFSDGSGITNNTLHSLVDANTTGVETNVVVNTNVAFYGLVDNDNQGTTTDINSFKIWNNNAVIVNGSMLVIGANNTLRLGQYGGFLFSDGGNNGNTFIVGTTNGQNVGTLTAGGNAVPNNPGEIVVTIYNNSESGGTVRFEPQITDNGSGAVAFVKQGSGSIKIDGHNTFSGGLYLLQGRVQFAGSEVSAGGGTPNPDGGGTGPVYVFPGSYLFPSALTATNPMPNPIFIAGIGDAQEQLGAVRGGAYSGLMTMIGDTTLGGNAAVFGQITGPFNLTIGSKGVVNGGANAGQYS